MSSSGAPVCSGAPQAEGFDALVFFPLVLFLVFSPFYDSIGIPDRENAIMLMDWQRLSELAVISLVLVVLCLSVWPVRRAFYSLPAFQLWGWSAFFAIGACSSTFAAHPRFAWVEWSWILICGLVAALLSLQSGRDLRSVSVIARLFVLSVLASYTPLYYIRNSDYLFESSPTWTSSLFGFYNVRVFSDYQTVIVCLLPWVLRQVSRSAFIRAGAWWLAGCYVALAFVVGSRSLVFGQLVASGAVLLILGKENAKPYLAGQIRLWLIGGAVYFFLFVLFPVLVSEEGAVGQLARLTLRYDSSGRLALWNFAFQMALENPWVGIGPMHFAAIVNPIAASPHNELLQLMAEFGVVAATLFVFLGGHWLFAVYRGMRVMLPAMACDERLFSISILAGLLALLAQSCVSPVFNNPQSQVLLIILGGILGGYVKWSAESAMLSIRRPYFVLAAVVALGVFLASCLPWAMHIEERNACHFALKNRPTSFLAPRFWQQGWLFIPCEPVL